MGGNGDRKRSSGSAKQRRHRHFSSDDDTSSDDDGGSSPAASSDSEAEGPDRRGSNRSSRRELRSGRRRRSRQESESPEASSKKRKSQRRERDDKKKRRRRERHRRGTRRDTGIRKKDAESEHSSSSDSSGSDYEASKPEAAVRRILKRYPKAAGDLRQLLEMIDSGQAVDVREISDTSMVKLLKNLFRSFKLKRNEDGVFLLPPRRLPTLDVVGSLLSSHAKHSEISHSRLTNEMRPASPDKESVEKNEIDIGPSVKRHAKPDPLPHQRRLIGPQMPSAELLAAVAELTEAETATRNADLEVDEGLFVGPPPPALVAETESANEAERFEEIERIMGIEAEKPYDVLGVNWKMSIDNVKKKYWKLSLLVHPDKCSHPHAHQAFVILNNAFKLLQDPDQRKEMDEKIKLSEEREAFKVELKALRDAAEWRRLQGISMEGDDVLLAEAKQPPKRDEWMTTLPPERKHGITMQSTTFSRTGREGRGDTSVWTESPLERAQKAKQSYLEAYDRTRTIASSADDDETRRRTTSLEDANLVDKYNRAKRSVSLVQKHKEESSSRPTKIKSKQPEKEEDWVGQHPWKPWDREKDLSAGRQKVNFDSKDMAEGLSSRFSSGSFQRSFL